MITFFALFLTFIVPFQASTVVFTQKPIAKLEFREFLAPSITELKPSEKLRSLQGQRVRITGFMAQMEEQPGNYFYLCSIPVYCDESGGGIGDLPVDAVRVVIRNQPKFKSLSYPVEVIGVLELGGQSEREKDAWAVRILAGSYKEIGKPKRISTRKPSRKPKQ